MRKGVYKIRRHESLSQFMPPFLFYFLLPLQCGQLPLLADGQPIHFAPLFLALCMWIIAAPTMTHTTSNAIIVAMFMIISPIVWLCYTSTAPASCLSKLYLPSLMDTVQLFLRLATTVIGSPLKQPRVKRKLLISASSVAISETVYVFPISASIRFILSPPFLFNFSSDW